MVEETPVQRLLRAAKQADLDGFEKTAEALIDIAHHINEDGLSRDDSASKNRIGDSNKGVPRTTV